MQLAVRMFSTLTSNYFHGGLIRAGISETVATKLTGHRTRGVFQRYTIVEDGMLQEAGARLTQEDRSKVAAPGG